MSDFDVVIIDQDQALATLLERGFDLFRISAITFNSAEAAQTFLEHHDVPAILIDIDLPATSVAALTAQVRNKNAATTFIGMTASPQVPKSLSHIFRTVLKKAFPISLAITEIMEILHGEEPISDPSSPWRAKSNDTLVDLRLS
ncbi:MAG: response regulator [Planctomycetota bacterium]|jgi:DNA-binding NtrC family response regulator